VVTLFLSYLELNKTPNPGLSDWPNEPEKYFCGPEEQSK
jgi:hypothetical protein